MRLGRHCTLYPVDRASYDQTIEVLRNALGRAKKIDRSEQIRALKRLAAFTREPARRPTEAARSGGALQIGLYP